MFLLKMGWLNKTGQRKGIGKSSALALNDGLCAEGAVYRQDVGLVLRSSTDVALTEWASEACFRKTIQAEAHQVRGTMTSRHLGFLPVYFLFSFPLYYKTQTIMN